MPSPYGPPAYIPNQSAAILADAFDNFTGSVLQRRRQKKLDEQAQLEQNARLYQQGVRSGAPPTSTRTDTIPGADFTAPSSADLAAHLRGAPLPGQGTTAQTDAFSPPTGPEFASMIANPGVTPTTRRDLAGGGATMSDGRDTAPTHPGAFDVATRQFGGSPLQLATAAAHTNGTAPPAAQTPTTFNIPYTDPRYQPLDKNHYVDTQQTPAAVAARDRMAEYEQQRRLAAELQAADPLRQEQIAEKEDKRQANLRAFNSLRTVDPSNPLSQGEFDPSSDYIGELRTAQGTRKTQEQAVDKNRRDYNAFRAEFSKHPMAAKPFDNDVSYADLIASERQNKGIEATDERQNRTIAAADLRQQRGLAAVEARTETREKIKSIAPLALVQFARFNAAVPTMKNQHTEMTQFENDALKDPKLYDGWDEFTKQFYTLPPGMGVKAAAERAISQSNLNKNNPRLARYIRAGARYAFEDGTIQTRGGTMDRVAMDEMISSVGPHMDEASIRDTQEGRQTRIDGYDSIIPTVDSYLARAGVGGGGGAGTAPPAGTPQVTQADRDHAKRDPKYAAWLRSQHLIP